jgi:hypothetical protein
MPASTKSTTTAAATRLGRIERAGNQHQRKGASAQRCPLL